jgi:hypothetical protein
VERAHSFVVAIHPARFACIITAPIARGSGVDTGSSCIANHMSSVVNLSGMSRIFDSAVLVHAASAANSTRSSASSLRVAPVTGEAVSGLPVSGSTENIPPNVPCLGVFMCVF